MTKARIWDLVLFFASSRRVKGHGSELVLYRVSPIDIIASLIGGRGGSAGVVTVGEEQAWVGGEWVS